LPLRIVTMLLKLSVCWRWLHARSRDASTTYRDRDALAAHRESEHFKRHAVGGLYQKLRERSLENLVALV